MSRLRQLYPSRYNTVASVHSEFESIVRYLNSAEIGNLMLSELMSKLFDAQGNVIAGVELRFDGTSGLEYRKSPTDEWALIVPADQIRGAPGESVGNIDSPTISNRVDYTAVGGQTIFPYTFSEGAAGVMVFVNGLLQRESAYTLSLLGNTVIFDIGLLVNDRVTIYSIRDTEASSFRRTDLLAMAGQQVFPFVHDIADTLVVYRNGVLQRLGAEFDYTTSPGTSTVTMTTSQSAGTVISIIVTDNPSIRAVVGLMLEDRFCTGGLIRYDRIDIPDDSIPQEKVDGLSATLAALPSVTVGPTPPASPAQGDLWIYDADPASPAFRFFYGTDWISESTAGLVPVPAAANAYQYLRVAPSGNRLEYATLSLPGVLLSSQRGAANGVAPLDATVRVPIANLPVDCIVNRISGAVNGSIVNGTYILGLSFGEVGLFDKLAVSLQAGTATAQYRVGGIDIGPAFALASTPSTPPGITLSTSTLAAPQKIELVITGASGASGLSWSLNKTTLSV
jgi:hypothetical protein